MPLTGTIYIAGAYTAPTDEGILANIEAALEAGLAVHRTGRCPVIVPHVAVPSHSTWNEAMGICKRLLLSCHGLVLIPGWEASKGACLEQEWAITAGMQVWELDAFLKERAA